jgi:hypothetical protein
MGERIEPVLFGYVHHTRDDDTREGDYVTTALQLESGITWEVRPTDTRVRQSLGTFWSSRAEKA